MRLFVACGSEHWSRGAAFMHATATISYTIGLRPVARKLLLISYSVECKLTPTLTSDLLTSDGTGDQKSRPDSVHSDFGAL